MISQIVILKLAHCQHHFFCIKYHCCPINLCRDTAQTVLYIRSSESLVASDMKLG